MTRFVVLPMSLDDPGTFTSPRHLCQWLRRDCEQPIRDVSSARRLRGLLTLVARLSALRGEIQTGRGWEHTRKSAYFIHCVAINFLFSVAPLQHLSNYYYLSEVAVKLQGGMHHSDCPDLLTHACTHSAGFYCRIWPPTLSKGSQTTHIEMESLWWEKDSPAD